MNDYDEQLLEGTPTLSDQLIDLETEQAQEQLALEQAQTVEQPAEATAEQQQTPSGMVEYNGKLYPEDEIEYETNIFGQKIPFLKRDVAREEIREGAKSGERQQEFEEGLAAQTQQVTQRMAAPGTGVVDFSADALNLIPRVDVPKPPKFEDEVAQTVRELSSVIIPTVYLGGAATGAVGGLAKGSKFLNNPWIKNLGNIALSSGTGAFVDYTVEINQQDDNLAGTLKKTWPRFYGWIPEDIATLDTDSPEQKRNKNLLEGVYLGAAADLLGGFARLYSRGRQAARWGPQTKKSEKFFKENLNIPETPEAAIEFASDARSRSLDELGAYNLSKSTDPNKPVYGYHDLYGYQEQAVRSVDNLGIVGASVDTARILNHTDGVYGRIGNSLSEGALKFANESFDNQLTIQRGLTDALLEADEYSYKLDNGTLISHGDIKDSGERLAAEFLRMDVTELRNRLNVDVSETNTSILSDADYKAVVDTLKQYSNDLANMDYVRAQSYIGTSLAGQISDTAQGMRLTEGTASIERAQEQILDRMEFLMVQKNMTDFATKRFDKTFAMFDMLTKSNVENMTKAESRRIAELVKDQPNQTKAAFEQIKKEATDTVNTIRQISREQPEMLQPLMFAYEMTDGSVDTISKLNRYMKESTGVFRKMFIDRNPEIPSLILSGFWSNVYNNTLSGFATPIKAGLTNTVQLIEKPMRTMAGGLANRDLQTVRRGWYQYSSAVESLQASFGYMKQVFKRSGMDPNVLETRLDVGSSEANQLTLLNKFADAKAAQGDYGPMVMAELANNMHALGNHPWMRFGTRAMQAFDGFTQSMVAMSEAKGRVFDQLTQGGKLEFDAAKGDELYRKVYNEMFDETGLISDKAVKHTAGEIAMNLDNELTDSLSTLIRNVPMLRPFLLFTKTPINELKLAASYAPLPIGRFINDTSSFRRSFDEMDPEEVKVLLASKGVEVDDFNARAKYNEIRADLMGRKAFGALAVIGAGSLFLNGNITGNGLYDRQKQSLRRDADWQPRSIRLPGGTWVSYDNLGPITSWLSFTVDIMDNGLDVGMSGKGVLAPNDIEENLRKAGFVLSAAITDKTALAGLEPLLDVLSLNPGALTNWSSSFLSSTIPGSSQLNEISKLLEPSKKAVEKDIISKMQNRLPFVKSELPDQYDWIDGGKVGVPVNNFARIWNIYMPWKVNGEISAEKQFLMDIEYDARATLNTLDGVELTAAERSEITNIMGRDGLFKDAIKRVMGTTDAKAFRKRYQEAVANGLDPELSSYRAVHTQLDIALREAMRSASARSSGYTDIQRRAYQKRVVGEYLRRGNQEAAERFLEYMKDYSY